MIEDYQGVIKQIKAFENYVVLKTPKKFSELQQHRDVERIHIHSIKTYKEEIMDMIFVEGFCGAFSWKRGHLLSLDDRTYDKDMLIYGYKWNNDCLAQQELDLLVGESA